MRRISTNKSAPNKFSHGVKQSSRAATLAALGFAVLLIPLAGAIAAGLVPCSGTACQMCSLAKLVQNVINFTILLAIPLAAVLFAWAGALYITARGDTGQIEKAHGIFGKVALGFVLALSGWLIVNTILVTIAKPSAFASGSSFFTILCVPDANRPMDKKLSDIFSSGNAPGGYKVSNICPSDHPNIQPETGLCCTTDFENCVPPPQVDQSCTPDFPTYDANQQKCCNAAGQCTAPKPDTQCTVEFPKYDASSNKCCKVDDPTQCKDAVTGGGVNYDPSVQAQAGDASGDLSSLLSCIGNQVSGGITVTSISDNMLSKYGGSKTWAQCRAGQCQHSANSCHYGGSSGGDISYAADLRTNGLSSEQVQAMQQAATQCGGNVNPEGDHLHVSAPGHGCF